MERPTTAVTDNVEDANVELLSHSFAVLNTLKDVIDCKRFSSLRKLLNTTAYVSHFMKVLQTKGEGNGSSMLPRDSSCSMKR